MEPQLAKLITARRALAWLLVICFCGFIPDAMAGDSLPVTHGSIQRDSARITFEWPEQAGFKASASGTRLTIRFDRDANPHFGQMLSSLYPYVVSAKRRADGKTIEITLDKPYRIRSFESDGVSGIDLLDIDPGRRPDRLARQAATLAPAAGDAAGASAAGATDTPAPSDRDAAPAAESRADADTPVSVRISASEDSAVLRFPFRERTALAAFPRGDMLWIVLGTKVPLDLSDFNDLPRTVIGKAQPLAAGVTILRIPLNDGMFASVSREEDSFEWAVLVNHGRRPPARPLKMDINTDPPAPPHVFINTLQMDESVTVTDPVIGDELIVVPLHTLGEGIAYRREFVDFTLLSTAAGIAVAKKSDEVTVSALRNGLRIALPQGAILTPGLPELQKSATPEALQSVPTLFPYDKWTLPPELPERAVIRDMMARVVESDNPQDANDMRLRLAQVYLGMGMAAEAIAMLDGIRRTDVNFYRSGKLAALRGAAHFMMGRHGEAALDFSASELNNNREMDYWRNMLADLQGREGHYDYLAMNTDYISRYPPKFRQKLAIVAADRAVDTKEYNTAVKVFETLGAAARESAEKKEEGAQKEPGKSEAGTPAPDLTLPISPYIRFLMAKIAADTGQAEDSLQELVALSEDYEHPFVRSRAEYSRIILEMNRDIINKAQVVERLERLRLAWHGDALELKVLSFLGEIYADNKDYVNAMRIWDNAVHAYAGTPKAAEISAKMEETFVRMFNEGTADSLPLLEALALYYQYKNYAPPGTVGREMNANLADRLVSMDLLDQAASLLEHQMRNDSEKSQRSQIGAKVATIHLLNHDPKKALRALQDSVYGENPLSLHQLRNRLAAESLVQLNDSDKAWQILAQDESLDAERIRLQVLWEKRDWARIIHSVENILKSRKDITAPITLDESEYVIKLALAYIFENNKEQLQYLHDYFTPLMADNPNRKLFEFITAADVTPTPTNFEDVVKSLLATRSFIDSYKAQIKTAGLNAVVPKATP